MPSLSPTLKDIARSAGVTPMTVSLALRGQPGVSESTRERIQVLAKEMGYQQDPVLAKLMSHLKRTRRKKPSTLAFITNHHKPFGSMQATLDTRSYEGARKRAQELGYELVEFQISDKLDGQRLSKILWTRAVDGILVGPLQRGNSRLDFNWSRFRCVAIGHTLEYPQLHKASNNQSQSLILALSQLHRAGYRRIGILISKDNDERTNHAWRAGYLLGRELFNIRYPKHGIVWIDDGFDNFARWMKKEKADVILGPTSHSPTIPWIERLGLRIPQDIGVAFLHLQPNDQGLSGIDQQWQAIGAAAVDRLTSLIHSRQNGIPSNPSTLMLDGQWVDGFTTRQRSV